MQKATLFQYAEAHDKLKSAGCSLAGNIFLSAPELDQLFQNKDCLLHTASNSIFLLVPRHGIYHDLFFLTKSAEQLDSDLHSLLECDNLPGDIRASIIGKEPMASEYFAIFKKHDFDLLKKLLRTSCKPPKEKILAALREYADENREFLGFAQSGDEEEILEILKESFDTAGDNLPELEEIKKGIEAREIAVLRRDGRILSLTYFAINSGIIHSFYDVTRKEFRGGNGYFLALASFLYDELKKRGIKVARSMGWREEANKKLVKHAKKNNQNPEGVVIYNTYRPLSVTSK